MYGSYEHLASETYSEASVRGLLKNAPCSVPISGDAKLHKTYSLSSVHSPPKPKASPFSYIKYKLATKITI